MSNETNECVFYCILLVFVLVPIIFIFRDKLIRKYRYKHPEKFYGGEVYKVNLLSITPKITVFKDKTRTNNIVNAETQIVDSIIVQNTSNDMYLREILTGKLIPVSTKFYVDDYRNNVLSDEAREEYNNYTHCVYVRKRISKRTISANTTFYSILEEPRKSVSASELEQYINERRNNYKDFKSFSDYIDNLFKQAESYYQDAEKKGEVSEEYKKQELLRTMT